MDNNISYIMTDKAITVYINAEGFTVNEGDSRFKAVKNAIRDEQYDTIPGLLDIKSQLISETNGELHLMNGTLSYKGDRVEPILAGRIIKMKAEGFNFSRFVLFLENCYANPTPTAREELYGFLEKCNLPVTDDGHFLAYKMVTKDFMDIHSNSMDNSIGTIVQMERDGVDADRNRTCSSGLHFCSEGYLGHYGRESSSQIVVLKINPADVVSIPTDYDNAKGRACRYEVVDAIKWDDRISPDFSAKYTPEPKVEVEEVETTENEEVVDLDVTFRWEVRDSDTAEWVASFETRSEAREARQGMSSNLDTFIWDAVNNVLIVGRTNPEFDFDNLDEFLETIEEDEEDVVEKDRWEIRDSFTGKFNMSFNSRKFAREYRDSDEFIWDTKLLIKEAGTVDEGVDLTKLD